MEEVKEVYNPKNKIISDKEICQFLKNNGLDSTPNDYSYYKLAFVHKSYSRQDVPKDIKTNDPNKKAIPLQSKSNERIEFLGDAILGLVIARYLYERFPDSDEGFLTKMRTKLVNGEMLAHLARKIGFPEFCIMSKHVDDNHNGRDNKHILEDAFESFCGAIFTDFNEEEGEDWFTGKGYIATEKWITNIIEEQLDWTELILLETNFKDQLLKYFQHNFNITPTFKPNKVPELQENGKTIFQMDVVDSKGKILGTGTGVTKKKGEQHASKNALIKLGVL